MNKKFESALMNSPTTKKIKNSLLFKVELGDKNDMRRKVGNKLTRNYAYKDITLLNTVPLPRDGHVTEIFDGQLLVFAGDRNKFPFNDLYYYKI